MPIMQPDPKTPPPRSAARPQPRGVSPVPTKMPYVRTTPSLPRGKFTLRRLQLAPPARPTPTNVMLYFYFYCVKACSNYIKPDPHHHHHHHLPIGPESKPNRYKTFLICAPVRARIVYRAKYQRQNRY
jgi:hypothetical protein